VVAATTGSTAAVVVDYIGIALQFSAFVIVLAVLALVLVDSPSPSPPVRAGVFVVLSPALMPQPPAADLTAWIFSAIAIGVFPSSFSVFGDFLSSSVGLTALLSSSSTLASRVAPGANAALLSYRLPPSRPPSWAPAASKAPTARADWSTSTRTARFELLTALLPPPRGRQRSEPTTPSRPPVLVLAPRLCHASRPSITTRTST
jgi:hypothetical protein